VKSQKDTLITSLEINRTRIFLLHAHPQVCILQLCYVSSVSVHLLRWVCAVMHMNIHADKMIHYKP